MKTLIATLLISISFLATANAEYEFKCSELAHKKALTETVKTMGVDSATEDLLTTRSLGLFTDGETIFELIDVFFKSNSYKKGTALMMFSVRYDFGLKGQEVIDCEVAEMGTVATKLWNEIYQELKTYETTTN